MSIKSLLLDADGVIQTTRASFFTDMKGLVAEAQGEQFLDAVFKAEIPALSGTSDFREDLSSVLRDWDVNQDVEEVLALWYQIDVVDGLHGLIGECRDAGVSVCLATNQQRTRMQFMRRSLNFDVLFDESFYSCEIGHAKPKAAYFESISQRLGISSDHMLFVDDNLANVEAAASVGLLVEQFQLEHSGDIDSLRNLLMRRLSE